MLFASLDAFAAVCATAHTSLQVNRQTERSSVGAASRWGAHPPGLEPVALHLPGFSRISSGEGASSAYGPQWDDVPVTCILSRRVCMSCSFWLVRECVGVLGRK